MYEPGRCPAIFDEFGGVKYMPRQCSHDAPCRQHFYQHDEQIQNNFPLPEWYERKIAHESAIDVRVVRLVDRRILGSQEPLFIPLPITDDRNQNPDYAAWAEPKDDGRD